MEDLALKTVLFYSEKDHEQELNLLCCYLFWFLIIDNLGIWNLAHLVNNIICLGLLYCACQIFLDMCGGEHMWLHVLIYKDCVKVLNCFAFGFPFMFAFHVFLLLLFWQSIYLQSFCGLRSGNYIITISLVPICESIMQEAN